MVSLESHLINAFLAVGVGIIFGVLLTRIYDELIARRKRRVTQRSDDEHDLVWPPLPVSCFVCTHHSGDGYNDNCRHTDLSSNAVNINTDPMYTRMDGCPLDVPG